MFILKFEQHCDYYGEDKFIESLGPMENSNCPPHHRIFGTPLGPFIHEPPTRQVFKSDHCGNRQNPPMIFRALSRFILRLGLWTKSRREGCVPPVQ
jgi:hypothetical protein